MIKLRSNGLERIKLGCTMIKLGQMVLKGVNWVNRIQKSGYSGLERSSSGCTMIIIRSNGLQSSQLGIQ